MFDYRRNINLLEDSLTPPRATTPEAYAHAMVHRMYRGVELKARLRRIGRFLWGEPKHLKDIAQVLDECGMRQGCYAGVKSVPIEQITGSFGRCCDFDGDFLPRNPRNRQRWVNIALVALLGVGLPPVDLLQVGDEYFVKDGHHRVSVARAMGQKFIDASVTVCEVAMQDLVSEPKPFFKKAFV